MIEAKGFAADSFRQFMEREMLKASRQKDLIKAQAVDRLAGMLCTKGYGRVKVDVKEDTLTYNTTTRLFSGRVIATSAIFDGKGEKILNIPITVTNSDITLPSFEIISSHLSTTKSEFEKNIKPQLVAEEQIKEAQAKEHYEKGMTELREYLSGKRDEVKASTDVPQSTLASTLPISKLSLPESTKIGNIIDLQGVKYQVTGEGPQMGDEQGQGIVWILTLKQ